MIARSIWRNLDAQLSNELRYFNTERLEKSAHYEQIFCFYKQPFDQENLKFVKQ